MVYFTGVCPAYILEQRVDEVELHKDFKHPERGGKKRFARKKNFRSITRWLRLEHFPRSVVHCYLRLNKGRKTGDGKFIFLKSEKKIHKEIKRKTQINQKKNFRVFSAFSCIVKSRVKRQCCQWVTEWNWRIDTEYSVYERFEQKNVLLVSWESEWNVSLNNVFKMSFV